MRISSLFIRRLAVAPSILLATLGCRDAGPPKAMVSGRVSFGGQPVERGDILFAPLDPSLPTQAAPIVSGSYQGRACIGPNLVRIGATRAVRGKTMTNAGGDPIPLLEEYIPAKYGPQTELRAEIASGKNTLDFLLEP